MFLIMNIWAVKVTKEITRSRILFSPSCITGLTAVVLTETWKKNPKMSARLDYSQNRFTGILYQAIKLTGNHVAITHVLPVLNGIKIRKIHLKSLSMALHTQSVFT